MQTAMPLTPKGTKLPLSPCAPHPTFSISALTICFQGHRKGGVLGEFLAWYVSLEIWGLAPKLPTYWRRGRGGVGAGQGRGAPVGTGEIGPIC